MTDIDKPTATEGDIATTAAHDWFKHPAKTQEIVLDYIENMEELKDIICTAAREEDEEMALKTDDQIIAYIVEKGLK